MKTLKRNSVPCLKGEVPDFKKVKPSLAMRMAGGGFFILTGGKDMIRIVLILLLLAGPAYAGNISFEEVKNYLANTVQRHEPEDKSINTAAFDYPAIDILPLWQKLGISIKSLRGDGDDSYLFDCKPDQKECFLPKPETKVIEHGNIKIIRVTKAIPWDYQYLFFKRGGEGYSYIDHLEYDMQKYDEPKLAFLENDLFYIYLLNSSGSDTISYVTSIFQIADNKIKELLWYPSFHERSTWGMCFDETIHGEQKYSKGILTLNYRITVNMNDSIYESEVQGELSQSPIIRAKKRTVLMRKPEGFVLDKEKSNASLEDIKNLVWGGYSDYYQAFQKEFDALENRDPKTKEWLRIFKVELLDKK